MTLPRIIPLLLAGGTGTRLWPVSRDTMPKQFLPLVGDRSTYQEALARVKREDLFAPPIVMTSNDFRFFARGQAEELGMDATVVLEPMRRESGPAIAAGAALARERDPQAIVLDVAADQLWLHPTRQGARDRRHAHGRCLRGKARCHQGRRLCDRWIFVELRQLSV